MPENSPHNRLQNDFRAFLFLIWKHLKLPHPTPVQYEIASYLQHGPRRRVVSAFRGVGKSWITSAYVLWCLWRDPNERVLVLSASKDRSDAFSTFTKRLITDVPLLHHLQPNPKSGQRDSNVAFDVGPAAPAHAPSVKSVGVYGQMTGSRAGKIIFDDAEVPNNSETATQREKLLRRCTEGGGAVLSPGGDVVYLGTPQTEDSLYNKLPDHGYEIRMWPAEIPTDADRYYGRLAPSVLRAFEAGLAGTPTDPARFGEMELQERRIEYGDAGYQLQFMLDTTLSDAERYPLKLADFMVTNVAVDVAPTTLAWGSAPEQVIEHLPNPGFPGDKWHRPMFKSEDFAPYQGSVMYIDPSGRGADETGYAVVKALNGLLYVRRWGGYQDGFAAETLAALATIAKEEKVNLVLAEDNFGDGMWIELFKPVLQRIYKGENGEAMGCKVEGEKVTGQKELRVIDALGPVLGSHRLVLDEEVIRQDMKPKLHLGPAAVLKTNLHQLTRITRDRGSLKHDDRLDALAGAVRYWSQHVGRDVEKAANQNRAERLRQELEDFVTGITGRQKGAPKTWSDRL